jgi:hypothetical protein
LLERSERREAGGDFGRDLHVELHVLARRQGGEAAMAAVGDDGLNVGERRELVREQLASDTTSCGRAGSTRAAIRSPGSRSGCCDSRRSCAAAADLVERRAGPAGLRGLGVDHHHRRRRPATVLDPHDRSEALGVVRAAIAWTY